MIETGHRPQRTLARSVEIAGLGFITGCPVTLRFNPAGADNGIEFLRTDLRKAEPIAARADAVSNTQRRTTLGRGANQVTLVEHALSALAGMRIDNCLVELDGPEPPGLDGSAAGFVEALLEGGVVLQTVPRPIWSTREPVIVQRGGASLSFFPADDEEFRISYLLDYGPHSPIVPQAHTETITPENYRGEIASSRTFVLAEEALELQRQGVGKHLTHRELLVFGPRGPIDNELRRPNEPARHKILDLIGDLCLSGLNLSGRLVAYRSGHPLNVEMAKTLAGLARKNGLPAPLRLAA